MTAGKQSESDNDAHTPPDRPGGGGDGFVIMEKTDREKRLKVLLVNGSALRSGNTFTALSEVMRTLEEESVDAGIMHIGNRPVQGCVGCYKCKEKGICVFRDETYLTLRDRLAEADGIIIGSPVYFGGPSGSLCALLDRLFYSCGQLAQYKPAASVVVCRRGGATATFDRLNKYFTILNMPVVPSQYWNSVHGRNPGEASQDAEGLQTMRTLAHNMAWMLRKLRSSETPASAEEPIHTNFIR